MARKKTDAATDENATADAKTPKTSVTRRISAEIDPLNEKVRQESEEAAMAQDQIRKGRFGARVAERREELVSMQPKAVTEPDMKGA